MRYYVTVAGREMVVELDGDRVSVDGSELRAGISRVEGTPMYRLTIDGRVFLWPMGRTGAGAWEVAPHGERWPVEVLDARSRHIRRITGGGRSREADRVLKAPMPGLVVRVEVAEGQAVEAGEGVVVLEAMKMENELRAAGPAVVEAVRVVAGSVVEKGDVLVEYGPAGDPG